MAKTLIHPLNMIIRRYDPQWGSHIPILARIMMISRGPVLELGTGIYSTPLLHYFCHEQKRSLFSYDDGQAWADNHKYWKSNLHTVDYTDNWDTCPIEKYHWGVVLIDHQAERRSIDAIRAARYADFVVLHDTNGRFEIEYHYEKVYPFYKYRYTYNKLMNHTDVVSNFIPVHNLWTI